MGVRVVYLALFQITLECNHANDEVTILLVPRLTPPSPTQIFLSETATSTRWTDHDPPDLDRTDHDLPDIDRTDHDLPDLDRTYHDLPALDRTDLPTYAYIMRILQVTTRTRVQITQIAPD